MERQSDSLRVFRFGSFELDRATGELRKRGVRVKLQEQPFQVLAALLARPGELVTREELHAKLWPGDTHVEFDQNLNAVVKKVRRALGDSSESPRFIETLPKKGYRFVYPVEGAGGGDAASALQEAAASKSGSRVDSTPHAALTRRRVWIAGIAVAIVAPLAIWIASRAGPKPAETTPEVFPPKSIAVLPLENLSGDPEQEYFADGMTDLLITELGGISALRVMSRTSVMQYKGTKRLLSEIGRELEVSHLVESSVFREGDKVRIGVRLLEAGEERQIWGETFQRPLGEVLPLQREIARAVADAVQVKLEPRERARLDRDEVVSPEALDAYFRGLDAFNPNKGGPPKAIEHFEEAIEKSPNYAQAYTTLGGACFMQALGWDQHLPTLEAVRKAGEAAAKALEIDDSYAPAHYLLGELRRSFTYDWEGAEASFRRALEIAPNDVKCHLAYGSLLKDIGRSAEAMREVTIARELWPTLLQAHTYEALFYKEIYRDYARAIAEAKKVLEKDPNSANTHLVLGDAYLAARMHVEALASYEKARKISNDDLVLASLAHSYGVTGKTREAYEIMGELVERSKKRPGSSFHLALIWVGLGEWDRAADALEKAYDERAFWLSTLKVDPRFDPLHAHPRFQALLKKMNFPT